jgi:hypothetical protein
MQTITTIGLDIAKSVFQVHGVDAGGQVIDRRMDHDRASAYRVSDFRRCNTRPLIEGRRLASR